MYKLFLIHCQPLHPNELWENFKTAMSEDYIRFYTIYTIIYHFGILQGQKKAYEQISIIFLKEGKSFANFP